MSCGELGRGRDSVQCKTDRKASLCREQLCPHQTQIPAVGSTRVHVSHQIQVPAIGSTQVHVTTEMTAVDLEHLLPSSADVSAEQ